MFKGQASTILTYIIVVILIIVISGGTVFYLLDDVKMDSADLKSTVKLDEDQHYLKRQFNILLVGKDKKRDGKNRSDTLMVANIDLEEKSVSMLSIPRDT
ncbi:MAG: hypothetical protein ACQERJ_06390, partial [Bacillota bacterium]